MFSGYGSRRLVQEKLLLIVYFNLFLKIVVITAMESKNASKLILV